MNLKELGKLDYQSKDFDAVLQFVSQIQNAAISKTKSQNVELSISDLREDVVQPSLPIELVLANAKNHDGRYFVVPQVVE